MLDESNININFEGNLGDNEIPGITDRKAIFPGSQGPMTELAFNGSPGISGRMGAVEDFSLLDDKRIINENNIPSGPPLEGGSFLGDSDGVETLFATRSQSQVEKEDDLTGEIIEEENDIASATRGDRPEIQLRRKAKDSQVAKGSFKIEDFFDSGLFVVEESGVVRVNNLFDGSPWKGEAAIFSLEGMDEKTLKNPQKFIKEAARRALTNSRRGHVIMADRSEGGYFEGRHNRGEYLGSQAFKMKPGDNVGIMFVPNGTVREAFEKPKRGGSKRPIFSLFTRKKGDLFDEKILGEFLEDSGVFGVEYGGQGKGNRDYKDAIVQLRGIKGVVPSVERLMNPKLNWVSGDLGEKIKDYLDFQKFDFDGDAFVVGKNGDVKIDFLFDGSQYKGEMAVFSLKDFDKLNLRSYSDLIKEAASRASSDSEMGHIVIKDSEEGAKIRGRLGEKNRNSGKYLGQKSFKMNPGDKIAFMLVPNGRVEEVLKKPNIGGAKAPLFSFAVESEEDLKYLPHQMVRVEKGQNTFAWEDKAVNKNSDRDYNDLIFSMEGVKGRGNGAFLEDVINPKKDWRDVELADEIINFGQKKKSAEFELMTDRFYSSAESISVWGYIKTEAIDKIDLQLKDGGKWQDISDITEFEQHPLYPDVFRFDVDLTEELEPGEYQLLAIARDEEGRRLEAVNETFIMLSLPEDYVLTNPVKAALEEAIDLDSYNPGVLARTTEWVVSVQAGNSAEQLALKVGADNLGATGHIPNTYIFEFPEGLEASKIEQKLDLKTVEFSYPLVPVNLSLLGIPNDPRFDKQWHLQNTGQKRGTLGVDLNVVDVWDKYRGEGVVIATVDDGLETNHPDIKKQYIKDLSWDFNDEDGNPSHSSKLVFERDKFLNFLEGDEVLEFFETETDFDEFLEETVTGDKISFVLPTSLTGLLENVNLKLEMPKGESWPEDLEVRLHAPKESPENPGTYSWGGAYYYYRRTWWPGWEGLESGSSKKLNLSKPDSSNAKNSIYKFDIDKFENKPAGGYWSIEVVDVDDKYKKNTLEKIAKQIRKTWDWTLTLNTVNPHGTAVAGIAAATANNGEGISGVAPGADLAGLRLIGDVEPVNQVDGKNIGDAFFDEDRNQKIDIFNNSWASQYFSRQPLALDALQSGFAEGRDGLGNHFVFAAGNDGSSGGDVNFNYLATSRQTITVGAVDNKGKYSEYSTPGASLLVSAFSSNEDNKKGIDTTDLKGNPGYVGGKYNDSFGGTSAAAPQVAGVTALMLEANPELSGRDVQYIFVETADRDRINDTAAGWTEGPDDGPRHSHKYGFGLVDAMAAVEAAETWQTVGGDFSPDEIVEDNSIPPVRDIPDADATGIKDAIAVKEMVNVEWVEVELDAEHSYRGDLEIVLAHTYTDPETGEEKTTESILAGRNSWPGQDYDNWTFASARHWGEPSTGTWEVRVADVNNDKEDDKSNTTGGTWNSWKLNIYGNSAPTATNLTNTQSYTEDLPLDLEDIVVSDKNAGNIITASFTLSNAEAGELSTGTAGDAVSTYDAETGEWSVSGKLEDVNALLAAVEFLPTENYNEGLTIATKVGDPVAAPLEGIITLEGIPVNDPPELTVIEPLAGAITGRPFTITYEDLFAASDATDLDGDTVSFQLEELLSGELTKDGKTVAPGEIVLSEGEEIVWTADAIGDGVEAFSVKAFDGEESSDVAVEVAVAVTTPPEPLVKLGDELQVNTYINESQASPEVAALADGGFVITWHSLGQDGSDRGIYGQRYDSIGNPVGNEFQINTYISGSQSNPSVAGLPNGGFVVAWESNGQDGSNSGIYAQRYDSNGNLAGNEFLVNTTTSGLQKLPSVKTLTDGGFVVIWDSRSDYEDSSNSVYGQRYDSNGNQVGSEFHINTHNATVYLWDRSEIAALPNGEFIVTWSSLNVESSDDDAEVYGQRYDSSGEPIGNKFMVANAYYNSDAVLLPVPSVEALAGGGFVVTWISHDRSGINYNIFGQRYDNDGNQVGKEFQVKSSSNFDVAPSVTALLDGGFVITWTSRFQSDVFGQRYDSNGNSVGEEFSVNTYMDNFQGLSSVATLADGQFVVVWHSDKQDGDSYGIYAQRFGVNTAPTLAEVSTLTGASKGRPFTITYEDLLAASDATDVDGDSISFQIEGLLSGELTKDGETVAPGEIVLSEGEEIVWTADAMGDGVEALTVKAFDGKEYSDVAVEVAIAVEENSSNFFTPDDPYYSFNDSPFQEESFSYFHLEDFEDGELNVPGVAVSSGEAFQSKSNGDSVDGDDGTIDGSGTNGRSWWVGENKSVAFTFDKDVLGDLPTHAGIVVTGARDGSISIEGFDSLGNSLGVATGEFKAIAQGNTDEDRFLGISEESGISEIKVSTSADTSVNWEVDHLQYGRAGLPTVGLTVTDAQASEDGGAGQLVVERTGNTSLPLTVNYSPTGSAINGSDYESLSGTVTIEAEATYATIPIIPIRDYNAEGEETIQISLTAGDYELGADIAATATLSDLTVPSTEGPQVRINPSNGHQYLFSEMDTWLGAQEQAEALGGNLVTISDATEQTWLQQTFANHRYWIGLNDSAIYGNEEGEHRWVSGEVVSYTNWNPSEPNNELHTPEGEDAVAMRENGEWNDMPIDPESLVVAENRYGIIEIDPATLDQPIVNMVVMDSKAGEDGNVGEILFARVGKLDEDLTLNYNVAGNATSGSDYQELNSTVIIPAGETLMTVPVIALVDNEIEADETVAIELTPGNYEIGSKHRGQISVIDQHPINRIANEVIGRDVSDFAYWTERWQNGETLEELRPEIIASAVDGAGNLGTELEIDGLYQKIVGRNALPSEIADWRSRLEEGATLSQVSQELGNLISGDSFEFIPTNSYVYTNPNTGNQYFLSTADTWLGAQDQAEALGGNLVTINDAAEGNWLLDKFSPSEYWMGLNDSPIYGNQEGQYQWVSGEEVSYTNWQSDEPSNKALDPEGEDFGEMKSNGDWNDVPNNIEAADGRINRGIIEISPDALPPEDVPLPRWTARFINRTWANVDDRTTYDFSNPVAVADIGPQEINGKIALKQNWGLGSPADGVQNDLFAMEASTRINFEAGKLYKITTQSDDGTWFRLKNVSTGEWTSDSVVLGDDGADWQPRAVTDPPRTIFFKVPETGEYQFYVDYYEGDGDSAIDIEIEEAQFFNDPVSGVEWNSTVFWWDRQEGNLPPTSFYREPDSRIGQINLGSRTRSDGKRGITFDWGTAAINNDARLPDNNFAIRSYTQDFLESGRTYRALVRGDDGFQLLAKHRDTGEWFYFTPQDEWQSAYGDSQVVEFSVPRDGYYDFHFHLYEERGNSYFDLSWEPVNFTGSVIATIGANIRSGPGTSYSVVRSVGENTNLTFDKWTEGDFVDYQTELDTASDIWYRIAGTTNEWISAAIVDGDPSVTEPVSP